MTQIIVKQGDSLSTLARDHLGSIDRWSEVYRANRATIGRNPNMLYPGQVLLIPVEKKATPRWVWCAVGVAAILVILRGTND